MISREAIKQVPILSLLTEPEIAAIVSLSRSAEHTLVAGVETDFCRRIEELIASEVGIIKHGRENVFQYLGRAFYELKVRANNGKI